MLEGVKAHVNLSCRLFGSINQIFSLFIRENEISINSKLSYRTVKDMGENHLTCNRSILLRHWCIGTWSCRHAIKTPVEATCLPFQIHKRWHQTVSNSNAIYLFRRCRLDKSAIKAFKIHNSPQCNGSNAVNAIWANKIKKIIIIIPSTTKR